MWGTKNPWILWMRTRSSQSLRQLWIFQLKTRSGPYSTCLGMPPRLLFCPSSVIGFVGHWPSEIYYSFGNGSAGQLIEVLANIDWKLRVSILYVITLFLRDFIPHTPFSWLVVPLAIIGGHCPRWSPSLLPFLFLSPQVSHGPYHNSTNWSCFIGVGLSLLGFGFSEHF